MGGTEKGGRKAGRTGERGGRGKGAGDGKQLPYLYPVPSCARNRIRLAPRPTPTHRKPALGIVRLGLYPQENLGTQSPTPGYRPVEKSVAPTYLNTAIKYHHKISTVHLAFRRILLYHHELLQEPQGNHCYSFPATDRGSRRVSSTDATPAPLKSIVEDMRDKVSLNPQPIPLVIAVLLTSSTQTAKSSRIGTPMVITPNSEQSNPFASIGEVVGSPVIPPTRLGGEARTPDYSQGNQSTVFTVRLLGILNPTPRKRWAVQCRS